MSVTLLQPQATEAPVEAQSQNRGTSKKKRKAPLQVRRFKRQVSAALFVGGVAASLTALSLSHLAHGIEAVTNSPTWESWAMAVGIDAGFVALEVANLSITEKARKELETWTIWSIRATLLLSAALNAYAFGAGATGFRLDPMFQLSFALILGVTIPGLIFSLTHIGSRMVLGRPAR